MGVLVPEDCIRLLCISLEEELGLGSITELLVFDCFLCILLLPLRQLITETYSRASLVAQRLKHLLAMRETWV